MRENTRTHTAFSQYLICKTISYAPSLLFSNIHVRVVHEIPQCLTINKFLFRRTFQGTVKKKKKNVFHQEVEKPEDVRANLQTSIPANII